ncbi:MAG: hypothetical protein ACYDGR_05490 [Candidatus Dormibacteria bacterium]
MRRAADGAAANSRERMAALVREHVRQHGEYPLLSRVANNELHALGEANRQRVMVVRLDSEAILLRAVEDGVAAGEFKVSEPWLAVAAMGAMGIRVAEWWGQDRGYTLDQVAETYVEFVLSLLHGRKGWARGVSPTRPAPASACPSPLR